MTASRKKQPAQKMNVPLIVFCIGEDAACYVASLMHRTKRILNKVIVATRGEITTQLIKCHRADLEISATIKVPILMAENNKLYEIDYDNRTKVIHCLDCFLYKLAS